MPQKLPDPNELWAQFITKPVGSLSKSELRHEDAVCVRWLEFLNAQGKQAEDTKAVKVFGTLGWISCVISLPAIFAAPPIGFAVWCFGTGAAYGAHRAAKTKSARLDRIELLTTLILGRRRDVVQELRQRP